MKFSARLLPVPSVLITAPSSLLTAAAISLIAVPSVKSLKLTAQRVAPPQSKA